jgi:hypothetical protein
MQLSLPLSHYLSLPPSLSLSFFHSLPVREREKEREKKRGRKRERELLFLFLKGMTGALAPFSYLVE